MHKSWIFGFVKQSKRRNEEKRCESTIVDDNILLFVHLGRENFCIHKRRMNDKSLLGIMHELIELDIG